MKKMIPILFCVASILFVLGVFTMFFTEHYSQLFILCIVFYFVMIVCIILKQQQESDMISFTLTQYRITRSSVLYVRDIIYPCEPLYVSKNALGKLGGDEPPKKIHVTIERED